MQLTSHKNCVLNDDLAELEWVFASVCDALEADQGKPDEEERARIRRLFVLACNGMSEPRSLRNHLVRSFTRRRRAA
jgi:hypothetical protein